jgi:hypothetical protein
VAAIGKSGQFQSGQFNEYEWLLSARSGLFWDCVNYFDNDGGQAGQVMNLL